MTREEAAAWLDKGSDGHIEEEKDRLKYLEAYEMATSSLKAWTNVLDRIEIDLDFYNTEYQILQDKGALEMARMYAHKSAAVRQIKNYIATQLEG